MEQQQSTCSCGAEGKTRIIYSCSGIGSNVGQLANAAACQLVSEGYGGGSCLAGVGGGIEKLISAGNNLPMNGFSLTVVRLHVPKKIMDDKGLTGSIAMS